MGKRNSTVHMMLRSMRQPTKLDEVMRSVPKPKGAIPNFGLPKWKSIPLEWKIPLIPGPDGTYHFSRKKIGRRLYESPTNANFDLTDPNHYELEFEYDSLHDQHLARYFSNEKAILRMKKLGFVTENLNAICSVREYNMYRKYLQKLHGDMVKQELQKRGEMEAERRDLKIANAEAQKEAVKLKSHEKKLEARSSIINSPQSQAAEKRRRQLIKQKQTEERLKMLELKKKDQKERMILRGKLRAEHLKRRKRYASEKECQKINKILLKCRKKDRDRKEKQEKCLRNAAEARLEAFEKKWMERKKYQEWLITIEKFILEFAQSEATRNIEKYMKKVERERERIKKKIENHSKFLKCYNARYSIGPKISCCKIEASTKACKKIMNSRESIQDGEAHIDECRMSEVCRCDVGSEFCMDLRQLLV